MQTGTLHFTAGGISTGNFNVETSGTLLFDNDFTLNAGATLTGVGLFQLTAGALAVNTALSSPQDFELDGGVLSLINGSL